MSERPATRPSSPDRPAARSTAVRVAGPRPLRTLEPLPAGATAVVPPDRPAPPGRPSADRWRRHLPSAAWAVPAVLLVAAVGLVDPSGPPATDDEAGLVARAATVAGALPAAGPPAPAPLAWVQLAGWYRLTGLSGGDGAVGAGRELVAVLAVVSAVLLWLLARRLGLSRPAAAAAVLLAGLSPLALELGRAVSPAVLAVPWLLGATLLATASRPRWPVLVATGACAAVAVLTAGVTLLAVPLLAWPLWRNAAPRSRGRALVVAGAAAVVVAGAVLLAVPGATSGLTAAAPSAPTLADTAGRWAGLDLVLLVVVPLAALACLAVGWLRLPAAAVVVAAVALPVVALVAGSGSLPASALLPWLPLGALVVAGAVQRALRAARRTRKPARRVRRIASVVLVSLIAAGLAAPQWGAQVAGAVGTDRGQPVVDAAVWVRQNVPAGSLLLAGDAAWLALVEAGTDPGDVVRVADAGTDAAAWPEYDYVVVTDPALASSALVDAAVDHGTRVAAFGSADREVTVLRVDPAPDPAGDAAAPGPEQAARVAAGAQLAANAALTFAPAVADLVTSGQVDVRVMASLTVAAGQLGSLTIADVPAVPGDDPSVARRQVLVSELDGTGLAADPAAAQTVAEFFRTQGGDFAAALSRGTAAGILVTWALPSSGAAAPRTPG